MTCDLSSRCPSRRAALLGFEFGAFGPLTVRHETVCLGRAKPVRLLYASDLHLGHWWTRNVPVELLRVVAAERPDVVLLGGDLVDAAYVLPGLRELVTALADMAPVAAIAGNHDARAGLAEVRAAVRAGGGRWLPDAPLDEPIAVDAFPCAPGAGGARVLCTHFPSLFPAAVAAGYRLVLAGHLHGGQCVLATYGERLYPAALVDRWHGLRFRDGPALLLVSRGVADTFPLRFNCPREVLVCDIC